MSTRALVILNPVAGPSTPRVLQRDRLGRALREAGLQEVWHETTPERNADRIIAEHPGEEPVVVIGGDGTVQAATRALLGTERSLLVIPRGSGNILAQRMKLSPRLSTTLRLLRTPKVKKVDVGSLGGEPFLLSVGMGVDALAVREAGRHLKNQVGKLAYVVGAARALPVRHHDFELIVDGRRIEERGASVMVANFGTHIGPLVYPPDADGTDGRFDVAVMKTETPEQAFALLGASLFPKDASEKGVKIYHGCEIRVRCDEALAVQVDGDDRGDHRELVCTLRPRALHLIVP
jgi:diacylglycerol kinase family enzyme